MWNKIRDRLINHVNVLLFFSILFIGCKLCGRRAEKVGNLYTLNHMHYNLHVFSIIIRSSLIAIILTGSQGNFGVYPEYRICEAFYKSALFIIRLLCILYFLIKIIPDFGHIL